ncbi:MAG: hypothetical protein JF593_09330 [Novosphingobium sp.]|nr:hypothetical protein [Novosphingobium sp.]
MSAVERRFLDDKTMRDAARAVFDARLVQVKTDLAARGVGGRVADQLGEEAKVGFDYAVEVAKTNRSIIAGTIAALVLWLIRHPLVAAANELLGTDIDIDGDREPEAIPDSSSVERWWHRLAHKVRHPLEEHDSD